MSKTPQNSKEYYRYCPGEERIKIADAVCIGRRRSNYPKCKGCPFNDEEKGAKASAPGAALVTRLEAEADRITSLFKANDIRAPYPDPLDDEAAWRIGQAVAQFLRSELRGYDRSEPKKSTVIVGRDMRKSGLALSKALTEGLRTGGSPVIDIGMVDTPQLYFAVNRLTCCGGVQVTASHNPGQYNGFKICGQKARPISTDTGLTKVCKIAAHTHRHVSGQQSDLQQVDLTEPYREFVLGFLRQDGLAFGADRPLRVVVDASNGMAGRMLPLIFGDVDWLEVVRLNFEHNGEFVHDPNPLNQTNLRQLCDRVIRSKADFGLCFDGDADRCVLVDEKGSPVSADLITALLAPYFLKRFPGSPIVFDQRSSRVVAEEIRKAGGIPRRERSGHAFIKKALADAKGAFGGEYSGHYYFRDNWFCDSGLIAFAEIVNLISGSGRPVSELLEPLRRYAGSGEHTFCCEDVPSAIKRLAHRYADAQIDYFDGITVRYSDWWFNVRPSITQADLMRLTLEANSVSVMETRLSEVSSLLGEPLQPGSS